MTTSESSPIGPASPFFIVTDIPRAVGFYRDRLGFELRFVEPVEDPFFAIVGRGPAQILLKVVDESVPPLPNHTRHAWAPWDAFVDVRDPDALASELDARDVAFHRALGDRDDGLRGFEVIDPDGYVLFFGRPT